MHYKRNILDCLSAWEAHKEPSLQLASAKSYKEVGADFIAYSAWDLPSKGMPTESKLFLKLSHGRLA